MLSTKKSQEEILQYRTLLLEGLEEKTREGSLENYIPYAKAAKAFPGGPHSNSFEIEAIDTHSLKEWANSHGFEVSFVTKNVRPEHLKLKIPPVLFKKKI